MDYFAVFGQPVLHSLSPQLFNAAFAHLGIDARYTRILPANAAQIVHIMQHVPLRGANITTPYKQAVMPYLHDISSDARQIGGVNTIVNLNGRLTGHNTDYQGVTLTLQEAGCQLDQCRCLVLGAGPAARAAVYGLTGAGCDVTVTNRSLPQAKSIAQQFDCQQITAAHARQIASTFQVVVSAVAPEADLLHGASLQPHQWLLDASYRQSAFSKLAKKCGCQVISGKKWLLHQAVAAYTLFLGDGDAKEAMSQIIDTKLVTNNLHITQLATKKWDADLLIADMLDFKSTVYEEVSRAYGN